MQAIRSSGNKTTERRFRFALVGAGIQGWTMRTQRVLGNPDFLFAKVSVAIFLDGCFWHGCATCGHIPKTRRPFWKAKIARNRQRDRSMTRRMRTRGFSVLRFWEHDLNNIERCIERVLIAVEDYPEFLIAEGVSEAEKQAVARVRRAGVCAPTSAILSWFRAIGPDCIMSGPLCDIRAVARAF